MHSCKSINGELAGEYGVPAANMALTHNRTLVSMGGRPSATPCLYRTHATYIASLGDAGTGGPTDQGMLARGHQSVAMYLGLYSMHDARSLDALTWKVASVRNMRRQVTL